MDRALADRGAPLCLAAFALMGVAAASPAPVVLGPRRAPEVPVEAQVTTRPARRASPRPWVAPSPRESVERGSPADATAPESSTERAEREPGGVHVINGSSEEGLVGDRIVWFSDSPHWWGHGGRRWNHRWHRGTTYRSSISGNAQPFISGGLDAGGTPGDACAVFPAACAAPSPRRARPPSVSARAATVTRAGHDWVLANESVTATLEVGDDCAMTLVSRGGRAAFATFDAPRCVVSLTAAPWSDREGAAVMVDWSGEGWSQRAVIALADDGDGPEATVTQTVREGGFAETRAVNLSDGARVWTVGDREVTLAPGEATHYGVRLGSPVASR